MCELDNGLDFRDRLDESSDVSCLAMVRITANVKNLHLSVLWRCAEEIDDSESMLDLMLDFFCRGQLQMFSHSRPELAKEYILQLKTEAKPTLEALMLQDAAYEEKHGCASSVLQIVWDKLCFCMISDVQSEAPNVSILLARFLALVELAIPSLPPIAFFVCIAPGVIRLLESSFDSLIVLLKPSASHLLRLLRHFARLRPFAILLHKSRSRLPFQWSVLQKCDLSCDLSHPDMFIPFRLLHVVLDLLASDTFLLDSQFREDFQAFLEDDAFLWCEQLQASFKNTLLDETLSQDAAVASQFATAAIEGMSTTTLDAESMMAAAENQANTACHRLFLNETVPRLRMVEPLMMLTYSRFIDPSFMAHRLLPCLLRSLVEIDAYCTHWAPLEDDHSRSCDMSASYFDVTNMACTLSQRVACALHDLRADSAEFVKNLPTVMSAFLTCSYASDFPAYVYDEVFANDDDGQVAALCISSLPSIVAKAMCFFEPPKCLFHGLIDHPAVSELDRLNMQLHDAESQIIRGCWSRNFVSLLQAIAALSSSAASVISVYRSFFTSLFFSKSLARTLNSSRKQLLLTALCTICANLALHSSSDAQYVLRCLLRILPAGTVLVDCSSESDVVAVLSILDIIADEDAHLFSSSLTAFTFEADLAVNSAACDCDNVFFDVILPDEASNFSDVSALLESLSTNEVPVIADFARHLQERTMLAADVVHTPHCNSTNDENEQFSADGDASQMSGHDESNISPSVDACPITSPVTDASPNEESPGYMKNLFSVTLSLPKSKHRSHDPGLSVIMRLPVPAVLSLVQGSNGMRLVVRFSCSGPSLLDGIISRSEVERCCLFPSSSLDRLELTITGRREALLWIRAAASVVALGETALRDVESLDWLFHETQRLFESDPSEVPRSLRDPLGASDVDILLNSVVDSGIALFFASMQGPGSAFVCNMCAPLIPLIESHCQSQSSISSLQSGVHELLQQRQSHRDELAAFASINDGILYQGFGTKRGHGMLDSWKKRLFTLTRESFTYRESSDSKPIHELSTTAIAEFGHVDGEAVTKHKLKIGKRDVSKCAYVVSDDGWPLLVCFEQASEKEAFLSGFRKLQRIRTLEKWIDECVTAISRMNSRIDELKKIAPIMQYGLVPCAPLS